nr:site-2 protease family protein [Bacteroidota bacterium]
TLFIVTIVTTTLAGAEFTTGRSLIFGDPLMGWGDFLTGFQYSFPFLLFLTVHEFGHYITARLYQIRVTLPYYIPFWFGFIPSFGTMGAVIKIQGVIFSRKQFFDIGVAGPLAGFVLAVGVLWYAFLHLPPPEHIFNIHPEYEQFGLDYANHVYQGNSGGSIAIGSNLLFYFFSNYVAPDPSYVPNPYEIIHYPWILAGYLALFFTSLNLMPIGQLDGGHILYGLFGFKSHEKISKILFVGFVFYAGLGLITANDHPDDLLWGVPLYSLFLYNALYNVFEDIKNKLLLTISVFAVQYLLTFIFPDITGYAGWLLFALLIGRVLGIQHPQAIYDDPLDWKRKTLGWVAFIVFILCFSIEPFLID